MWANKNAGTQEILLQEWLKPITQKVKKQTGRRARKQINKL